MKKLGQGTYRYRSHYLIKLEIGWKVEGPAMKGHARTLKEAARAIDESPGTPSKLDPRQAGKLGAAEFYKRYQLQPTGTNNFAIVSRETGQVVNTLNGGLPWKR